MKPLHLILPAALLATSCAAPSKKATQPEAPQPARSKPAAKALAVMTHTSVNIGYRVTDGRPLTDTGNGVGYDGPLPELSLAITSTSLSIVENKGDHTLAVISVPWSQANMMPAGFFGFITNSVQAASPVTQ